jgi:predicted TIM-barrel fold metal-dependent hydrolase
MIKRLFLMALVAASVAAFAWLLWPATPRDEQRTHYVDLHVHTAGLGYGDSGAFINQAMRESYKFPVYLWAMGVTHDELEVQGDALVIDRLAAMLRESQHVQSAVVLAMDGVINENGNLDRERTQIYVPNEFVASRTALHDNLEFGASINPARPDAITRLRTAHANGARLVKWIPNIMLIDPADPAHSAFYREMAALDLPLLSHTGQERSFAGADDSLGDPVRLKLPLELGVTVIAAHLASTGDNEGMSNYRRILSMFSQYPKLYTEISSLTQINKLNYLSDALGQPGVVDRMLYGTDWPLQFFPLVSPLYHLNHIGIGDARSVAHLGNIWDRDVALKEFLGVPREVFERTRTVLKMND